VRDGLESVGAALADGPAAGAGRWVAANAGWLRVVVAVLGGVILLWGNEISERRLFWALVVVLVLLMVVQVLVGAGNASRTRPRGTLPGDDRTAPAVATPGRPATPATDPGRPPPGPDPS
jgi:hypothetical protein